MHKVFFAVLLSAALFLGGCDTERARLAKIPVKVEVKRFEQDLFELSQDNFSTKIAAIQAAYGEFFPIFCTKIIQVGSPDSMNFKEKLLDFLKDTIVQISYAKAQEIFPANDAMNLVFTTAFKRWRLYFPSDSIPQIFTYTSGVNESIILADNVIAIGLDKYLGADFDLYSHLGYYRYLKRNMYPAKMYVDAIRFYAGSVFAAPKSMLLDYIIEEGKTLYLTKRLLPDQADTCLFGFGAKQLAACFDNEAYMWNVLLQDKLLFSRSPRDIRDMMQEAPFTIKFSQEAPGRAAVWIGYRIVDKYMRKNGSTTLPQLMNNHNAQSILDASRYNPL
jgi:hypothetical protein